VAEHNGRLPDTLEGLRALKGIGRYTAAAVACFAYGQHEAVMDTNVRRVLGRIFAADVPGAQDDDRLGWQLAAAALPAAAARSLAPEPRNEATDGAAESDAYQSAVYQWNQALMDLGATICISRAPRCLLCPAQSWCSARAEWRVPAMNGTPEPLRMVAEAPAAYQTTRFAEAAGASVATGMGAAGPRARGSGTQKGARSTERFEGSRRWYRGRIVDALRALPPGTTLSLDALAQMFAPNAASTHAAGDVGWLLDLVRALARDGLVDLQEQGAESAVLSLPD
jgi:A/G-specific adenine glycosylase